MPRPDNSILRFERNLQNAIDRFAIGLRRHLGGELPARPRPDDADERMNALVAEDARLRRKARRSAPCYDLNRHIAVRRLIATFGARPVPAG